MNRAEIAELNAVGIDRLDNLHLHQAVQSFTTVLVALNGEFAAELQEPIDENHNILSMIQESPVSIMQTDLFAASSVYMHIRGIAIAVRPNTLSMNQMIEIALLTSISMFNIGLVYHVGGVIEEHRYPSLFQVSLTWYRRAKVIIANLGIVESTGNVTIDTLAMALYNNLAHVCSELGQTENVTMHHGDFVAFCSTIDEATYQVQERDTSIYIQFEKTKCLLNAVMHSASKQCAPTA